MSWNQNPELLKTNFLSNYFCYMRINQPDLVHITGLEEHQRAATCEEEKPRSSFAYIIMLVNWQLEPFHGFGEH